MKKTIVVGESDAILITDIQNDFLPGGALPVADGNEIIPVLNVYASRFAEAGAVIFASKDWHPPNHCSFKKQGGQWPSHAVQDSHKGPPDRAGDRSALRVHRQYPRSRCRTYVLLPVQKTGHQTVWFQCHGIQHRRGCL